MRLELVTWIDSIRHVDGWQPVEHYQREAERPLECETAGWVIHENATSIMVAQSRMTGDNGAVTEVIQIPTIAIKSRKDLEETVKKKRAASASAAGAAP
jgi:hypothetical protein